MSSTLVETLTRGSGNEDLDRLSAISLLAEGAVALQQGNEKRALLLFGAATISTKYKTVAYPVYGYVTLRKIQEQLSQSA